MRLLAFGGRNYRDWDRVEYELQKFIDQFGRIDLLIYGDATGADRMAASVAHNKFRIPTLPFPADWANVCAPGAVVRFNNGRAYNARAGFDRNQRMIDEGKPDWGIGFQGGNGTRDMAERLERAGIPIWDAGYKS
jgi:hypothetical protein